VKNLMQANRKSIDVRALQHTTHHTEHTTHQIETKRGERQSSKLDDDDDSTLGLDSTHQSERSGARDRSETTAKGGKIGKLFNNLRDMIDPPSESKFEGGSKDESTDGVSC
jgi:hypothetical protein